LRKRCRIEMPRACGVHEVKNLRRGIGLYGIERVARKLVDKAPRGDLEFFRIKHIDRFGRSRRFNEVFDRGETWHRRLCNTFRDTQIQESTAPKNTPARM